MSEQKNPQVSMYVKAISEKVAKEANLNLNEAESKSVYKKIYSAFSDRGGPGGSDVIHVGSGKKVHAYNIEAPSSSSKDNHYAIHDEHSGKTSEIKLPGNKKVSEDDVKKHLPDNAHHLAKHIAKDHNESHVAMHESTVPQVSMYIQAISEQAARERGELLEAKENKKITSKVAKHIGVPEDDSDFTVAHVHSHDNHHTYSAGESHWSYDGEPAHYSTHDTKTGKTHDFTLPAKKQSADQVKKVMDKAIPGGVHPDHAKAVAAEHNG